MAKITAEDTQKSRLERMLKDYDKSIDNADNETDKARSYSLKAYALIKLGRDIEALECYNSACELQPDNPEYLLHRAKLHAKLGNIELAATDAALVQKSQKDKEKEVEYKEDLYTGTTLNKLKENPELEALIEKKFADLTGVVTPSNFGIPSDESKMHYNHQVSVPWGEESRDERLLRYYNRSLEKPQTKEDKASLYDLKAGLLIELGRDSEALECYNNACELQPDKPAYLLHRAELLAKMGDLEKAVQDIFSAEEAQKLQNNKKKDFENLSLRDPLDSELYIDSLLKKLKENPELKSLIDKKRELQKIQEQMSKHITTNEEPSKRISNANRKLQDQGRQV